MGLTPQTEPSHQADIEEFASLESVVRSYCRVFNRVFTRASGASIFDQDGRRYVDFLCSAGALGYGHNNPRIKEAVVEYLRSDGIISSLDLHTTAKLAFLRKFRDVILVPRGLDYRVQFCGPTGSDAVEAALKLARKVTGRGTIAAFTNAYHGLTLGALAVTASGRERAAAGIPLQFVIRLPFEGYLDQGTHAISVLEGMLQPGSGVELPAAIIVETVQAEGGINVASTAWLRHLSDVAQSRGILLIVDDIQVGSGRTGTFFSFERAGIRPDIVCLSKAIGGIGMPMALTLINPDLDQWSPGEHVGTFRGNNLAFVAAAAALEYWREPSFEASLETRARQIRAHLLEIAERHSTLCCGVRGIGMIHGLVWREPALSAAVVRIAFEHGLLTETAGSRKDVTKLLPPLTISQDELQQGLAILSQAVDDAATSESLEADPGE
jgi:diaminobutyrate-2-oxoglutarate transaminase